MLLEYRPILILLFASLLDYLIGDPWSWPHPTRLMGWVIDRYTHFTLAYTQQPQQRQLAGIGLGLILVIGSGGIGWGIVKLADQIDPYFSFLIESLLLASCFAGRSLRNAAFDVLQPFASDDLETARSRLSLYVGRDTANLTAPEILRAILETVAENTTDGVTAPLFYAILGALITPLGSVPLSLAYKGASTLDSMVGYKQEPYLYLGWFSAKLEDILTWLPCRLTVLILACQSSQPQQVLKLCRRDAPRDPSPNAGWSECAYAAVLGVQLGGTNTYQGIIKQKPLLGDSIHPLTPLIIAKALELMRWCYLLELSLGTIVIIVLP